MAIIVFTASEPFFAAASLELRAVFPGASVYRLGPDTGRVEVAGIDIADVARECLLRPIIFVRHLMRYATTIPISGAADDVERVRDAVGQLVLSGERDSSLALQVWTSGVSTFGYRSDEVWQRIADDLRQHGFAPVRGGQNQILSVCVTPNGIVLGLNRREDALADWPGGRVRLARERHQVSRAEFKLEELFKVADLSLPIGGTAVDLGASPGGWTRIARRAGLTVWAVDPGDLDPRVAADPDVHHVKTTAGRYLAETELRFDLLLNDMRMVAGMSCEIMLAAAPRLNPGALAIMTLKISPRDPLQTVNSAFAILKRAYDVMFARQLYHNRNEVTVVLRRRG